MGKTLLQQAYAAADVFFDVDHGRRAKGMELYLWYIADRLKRAVRLERADESGASLVEYALLVALIAVVCIVAVSILGSNASNKFSSVGSALQ